MRIIIFGDSHTTALAEAQRKTQRLPDARIRTMGPGRMFTQPFHAVESNSIKFLHPDLTENFRILTECDSLKSGDDVIWGLSIGFHTIAFLQEETWRQFAPAELGILRGRTPISRGVTTEIILAYVRHSLAFFDALRQVGACFFVISSPPLRGDFLAIIDPNLAKIARAVDSLFRKYLTGALRNRKVSVILPPAEAIDADGTLRPEYSRRNASGTDWMHANLAYGALVLDRISLWHRQRTVGTGTRVRL